VDHPRVLDDPLALAILGEKTAAELRASTEPGSANLRAFVAARSRFAEDHLAVAVRQGVRQCVVLGAGLDTFAYRNPFPGLRVIEVDHPATQAWKRDLLASAGIAIPASASFVAVDFARQTLFGELQRSEFCFDEPAFFSWLGVVPYLTRDAALGTLRWIGSLPSASSVAFDYAIARTALNFLERTALDALSRRVARAGEPFQLFFEPQELSSELSGMGFRLLEDLGAAEINARYFTGRTDGLKVRGNLGHLMSATV
jgi:methyltransferase (TIGR00027 family)